MCLNNYDLPFLAIYMLQCSLCFCFRLIDEGKLMDALALSDRFLRNGASDQLLQLVIERTEEIHSNSAQRQGFGGRNIWSNSWQYCLRLKDKQLAARLALRFANNFLFMILWEASLCI